MGFTLGLLWITACSGAAGPEAEPTVVHFSSDRGGALTTIDPTAETEDAARPTITPLPTAETEEDGGYPAPPTSQTPLPEGYPAKPTAVSPYPAPVTESEILPQPEVDFATLPSDTETAWVVAPSGVQCEPESSQFKDIVAAVEALNEVDVDVYDGVTESRIVCAACGCPESTHYRLLIEKAKVDIATDLGFIPEAE